MVEQKRRGDDVDGPETEPGPGQKNRGEPDGMEDTWELLYGILVSPKKAIALALERRPLWLALVIILFTGIISGATIRPDDLAPLGIDAPRGVIISSTVAVSIISLFLLVAGFHLLALLFGGKGSYLTLLPVIGLSNLPFALLAAPLGLIQAVGGVAGMLVNVLGQTVTFIWVVVLEVMAIRASHGLSTGRAVLTLAITMFLMFLLILVLVVVAVVLFTR